MAGSTLLWGPCFFSEVGTAKADLAVLSGEAYQKETVDPNPDRDSDGKFDLAKGPSEP